MEVSNQLVSWFTTYLRDLQPTFYGGYNPFKKSTMDIPVKVYLGALEDNFIHP